ncbi:methyltransferase RsmF C-terminal domain-like protein [Compostibacter hankyongensis]|uniref:rRNA cytosine-C5-methyltransferase n=1 Tax=Compostibacter hankyongensis TaxID=1007089 RepID=A0ABP8G7P5_9BACT
MNHASDHGPLLPEAFLDGLEGLPGFDRSAFVAAHQSARRVTSLRVNPAKLPPGADAAGLIPGDLISGKVPWCEHGFYLSGRPAFVDDPLWHAGAYYVQEASSMFAGYALQQLQSGGRPLTALDLCAAPGGKSTHLSSVLPAGSVLVSNEVIRSRSGILLENLVRWGSPDLIVTQNDPQDFSGLGELFDVVLVDAPCSGSGLFRRDPAAVAEWSPGHVTHCSLRQRRILADVLPALKEGGFLIYSTCSYSREEDEDIADWLSEELGLTGVSLPVPPEWGITAAVSPRCSLPVFRFYPDKVEGEGLFLCVMQKKGAGGKTPADGAFRKQRERRPRVPEQLLPAWLEAPSGEWLPALEQDELWAVPKAVGQCRDRMGGLRIRQAGIHMGKWLGGRLLPAHALALSTRVRQGLPAVPLDTEQALKYLRKEDAGLENVPAGWVLARYKGMNLGWMKGLGGRVNNYYPKQWRIRKR